MQGSLEQPPIIVRGSRGRAAWLVFGSAIFVAAGVGMSGQEGSLAAGLTCIGFFGLCGLIGLWMMISPARLEIGPSGLVQTILWRTIRFAWTDIYSFRPAMIGIGNKAVGFDFLVPRPGRGALRQFNSALVGVQGSLPLGWEIAPEPLARLLNEAREHWLAAGGTSPSGAPAPASPPPTLIAGLAGARMNRRIFWLATAGVFAIAAGLSLIPGLSAGIGPVSTVFFIRISAARLHDLGRSGWWQLILYAIQIPAVILVGVTLNQSTDMMVAVGLLIELVFIAILGVLPGEKQANRFGPPPGQPTPIASAEAFR